MGSVFRWTGQASSDFGAAGNWYDVTTGVASSVVPGSADEALVTASGSITGYGNVLELALTGTVTGLGVSGLFNGDLGYLGGTVTLAPNALLYVRDLLDIGDESAGTLAGQVPTVVSLGAGSEIEAQASSANAEGIIVGQGAGNATLTISQPGAAVLSYANAGGTALTVGEGELSSGQVSVSGSGSALGAYGKVSVGFGGGGGIAVDDGARLVAGVDTAGDGLSLGTAGGGGELTLADGGQALLLGQTSVAGAGYGEISVTGGSGLFAQSTVGAALKVGTAFFGRATIPNGSVLVSDPYSFVNVSGGMDVGAGGNGELTLENDARLVTSETASPTTPALSIAAGGVGTVTVQSQAELVALGAGIAVGAEGYGILSVQSANVTVTVAPSMGVSALDVGAAVGAVGLVDVEGGLILDTQAAGMIIGDSGSGTMSIAEDGNGKGGLVLTGDPTAAAGVSLGVASGASGLVLIDGSASGLGVYGAVDDGVSGQGSIAVSDGGHLIITLGPTVDGLVLGVDSGGSGTLSVDGGGQAYVLGFSVIGGAGTGALTITGGSSFTGEAPAGYVGSSVLDAAMVLGLSSTGTGSVLISDPGTYVPLDGLLVVGDSGQGSLGVTNGAILSVDVPPTNAAPEGATAVIIGDAKSGSGTLSVSGQAQAIISGGVEVGGFGHGELDVSGATLTYGDGLLGGMSIESDQNGGSGVVNVAGGEIADLTGSGLSVGGTLTISQVGSVGGTVLTGGSEGLTISGEAETGADAAAYLATVSVSGSASGLGVVGDTSITNGTLALSYGARLTTGVDNPYLTYGLQIEGGGSVSLSGGAQASVTTETEISQGSLSITEASGFTGDLAAQYVSDGGYAMLLAGYGATVLISDPSTYVNLAGGLLVGDGGGVYGDAFLTVANGAMVVVTADGAADLGVGIGNDQFGDTLTVEGSSSLLADTGLFTVGASAINGSGDLMISAGGTVTVAEISGQTGPAAEIGGGGSGGGATVTGTDSTWTIGGALDLGGNGGGSVDLSVVNGGQVSAGAVVMNDDQGQIEVFGGGATLDATSFTLGSGLLYDGPGGTLNVSGGVGLNGTVELFGGAIVSSATVSVSVQTAIDGYGTLSAGAILDLGAIAVNDGTMTCLGTITGTGDLTIGNQGVLVLGTGEAASVGVDFLSGGASVVTDVAGNIAGTIDGWALGDFVDLQQVTATSESFANGTLSLFGTASQLVGKLSFAGAMSSANFTLTALAGGGTQIGYHG